MAKAFYDKLLGAVGIPILMDVASGGRVYGIPGGAMFCVLPPYNGEPATAGNGCMVAFAMNSREQVDLFHRTALELGGVDEGAPGPRGGEEANAYAAYVRDLEGNKLCAAKFG